MSTIKHDTGYPTVDSQKKLSQSIIRTIIKKIKDKGIPKCIYIGIFTVLIGVSLIVFQPYEKIFKKMMIYSEGGFSYAFWQSSTVQLQLGVFLFNITNKEAFLEGREKLHLEEVGPYIYREVAIHHNVTFNHENGTMSSNPRYTLEWDPDQNTRSEDDIFVLPHVAMLLFSSKVAETSSLLKLPINTFIEQTSSSPIVEQTAKEFLFGYENAFIRFGHTLMPQWITFEKIGLLDRLYNHHEDTATTYTGETDYRIAGLFETYNGLTYIPYWEPPCNKLRGSSDGKKFGNNISLNDTLYYYRKGMCRSIPISPIGMATVNGIPSIEYSFEENIFDNGDVNQRNKCFCRNGRCLPRTVQDITDCYYGFHVGISFPHFYKADSSLWERFEGLKPNASIHDSRIFVEPDTGYITKGYVGLQLNAVLGDLSGVLHCEHFSNLVLPMAWAKLELKELYPALNALIILSVRILPVAEIVLACLSMLIGTLIIIHSLRALIFCEENVDDALEENFRTEIKLISSGDA